MASTNLPLPLSMLMDPQGYRLDPQVPGRQAAGAGFLEAYLRYSGNEEHHLVVTELAHGKWFHCEACKHKSIRQTQLNNLASWGASGGTGAISLPGPGLDDLAWKGCPGMQPFRCGISTHPVQQASPVGAGPIQRSTSTPLGCVDLHLNCSTAGC